MALILGGVALGVGAMVVTTTLGVYTLKKTFFRKKDKDETGGRDAIFNFAFNETSSDCEIIVEGEKLNTIYPYKQRIGFIGQYNAGKTYLVQKLTKANLNPSYDMHTKGMAMIYDA